MTTGCSQTLNLRLGLFTVLRPMSNTACANNPPCVSNAKGWPHLVEVVRRHRPGLESSFCWPKSMHVQAWVQSLCAECKNMKRGNSNRTASALNPICSSGAALYPALVGSQEKRVCRCANVKQGDAETEPQPFTAPLRNGLKQPNAVMVRTSPCTRVLRRNTSTGKIFTQ